ncbi:MAG: helix-turn-helix domain-containing protein, partial [Alphaproteobacteria bacterium]|nr:helix-turn-helix domain-containing protein [Alphaproteobacteria bacterium]
MPDKANDSDEHGQSGEAEAVGAGSDSVGPENEDLQTVGTTLRLHREARGEELRYVAQVLRIRYPYLKAIEDGLIDELPGPTYAVGFVRTYAEHLGLDTEKMVAQFKAEVEGLNARADLHFPAPLPEGKIPSGAILLVAVVLAAMVYGAWIYLSSKDEQVAEIVPQLPNRISEIIKGKAPETPAEPNVVTTAPVAEPRQSEPTPSLIPEPVEPAPSAAPPVEPTVPETPAESAAATPPETAE